MNGKEWYGIGLETSGLDADTRRAQQMFRNVGQTAVYEGQQIDNMLRTVGRGMATYLGGRELLQLGSKIFNVRGEIQQLNIAFETMLGSKAKADQMMSEIITMGMKTPFTLRDVATNVKQLMAMGIETDHVIDELKALGDVAAGVSAPISRLAINYGQVMSLGKLQSREARDFAMAGVDIIGELADMMGKARIEVEGMMSNSQISSQQVTEAFRRMTSEGGRFYNLMEKQNASITGQFSNLQDKLDIMFNKWGEANEGVIYAGIEGATTLIEHYNEIGKTIAELVAVYGTYKAALITVTAIDRAVAATKYTAEATELTRLLTLEQQAKISKQGLIKGSAEHAAAIKAEIVAEMERQASIAAATNTEIAALQSKLAARKAEKLAAIEAVAVKEAELAEAVKSGAFKEVQAAQIQLETAQKKLNTAATAENTAAMELNSRRAVLDSAVRKANTIETGLNTAAKNANVTSTNILSAAKLRLSAITTRLNAIIAANPYTTVAVAVAALGYAIYKLTTYQTEAEKRFDKLNDSVKEFRKDSLSQISTLSRLKGELSSLEKGTEDYQKVKDKIIKEFGKYDENLSDEIDRVGLTTEAYNKLTESITKSFGARQYDKFQEEQSNYLGEVLSDNLKNIQDKLIDELGDEAGTKYFSKIREAILNQRLTIGTDGAFDIQGLDEDVQKALDKISGAAEPDHFLKITNYEIESYIQNVIRAQNQVDSLDEKAKQRFGITSLLSEDDPDGTIKVLKTIQTQIDETKQSIVDAENELKKLRAPDSTATIEDIEKQEQVVKGLKTKLETLTGIKKKETEKQLKTEEERLKAVQELADQELSIWQNLEQSKVDAMKAGAEKQRKQAKLNYDRELADIEKQGRDYLEKLNDSKGLKLTDKGYITELPADVQENLDTQKKNATKKYNAEVVQINLDSVKAIKSIWEDATDNFINQRERETRAVNQKYDSLIKKAKELNSSQSFIDDLEQKRDASLSKLFVIDWIDAFGDLDKISTDVLESMRDQLKAYISQLSDDLNKDELKDLVRTFEDINRAITARNPFGSLVDAVSEYNYQTKKLNALKEQLEYYQGIKADLKVIQRIEEQITETQQARSKSGGNVNDASNEAARTAGEVVSAVGEFTDMLENWGLKLSENGEKIKNGYGQVYEGLAELDLTKPGTIITASLKALAGIGNIINGWFGIFSPDKAKQELKELENASNEIRAIQESVNKLLERRIDLIKLSTAAEAEYLDTLNQETAEKFKKYYENIFEGLYDNEIFGLAGKNNDLSLDTIMEKFGLSSLEEFVAWWNDAGYTDLLLEGYNITNEDYWQEIIDGWNSVTEAAEQSSEATQEAITGISFDELKDSLDSLVTEVSTTAEDIAKSFTDTMEDGILNWVKTSYLNDALREWYDQLAAAYSDNMLTSDEYSELEKLYNNIYNQAQSMYDTAAQAAGVDVSANREASAKGIATASQDSVDELNGRATVIQSHTYEMNNNVKILTENSGAILGHLAGIRENTNNLKQIQKDMTSMKRDISDLTNKGIKIRN